MTFSKRYPKVKQIRLQENFRSSEGVIKTAQQVIEQNTERLPKKMVCTNAQPYEPGDITALEFGSPEDEARFIAQTIRKLRGSRLLREWRAGLSYSDCAVLLLSVSRMVVQSSRRSERQASPHW